MLISIGLLFMLVDFYLFYGFMLISIGFLLVSRDFGLVFFVLSILEPLRLPSADVV